jgi:hypothetical protein
MSHFELLKVILERKHWILLVFILTACAVSVHQWRTPYKYESSVKIFIEDEEYYSNDLGIIKSNPQSRIYHYVKSTEMYDYLIQRFELYKYYGIDSASFMHYENMTTILNQNIEAKWDGHLILTISVKDRDRYMAANIANEMFSRLNEMNRGYLITMAQKKLDIHQQLINNNQQAITLQTMEFQKLLDECRSMIDKNSLPKAQNVLMYDIKNKLGSVVVQLSGINSELLKSTQMFELSAAAMKKDNIVSLRVVNTALPDTHVPINFKIFNIAFLSFVAAVVTVLFIIIYFEYKIYFRMIFNSSN